MFTVVERRTSPLQFAAIMMLFIIAIVGYILFNAWHNTADADENHAQQPSVDFKLNTNEHGLIDTQKPVILNSNTATAVIAPISVK